MRILGKEIGLGQPCYTIAEIGINHNGSLELAMQLIQQAASAGFDACKFQKRTPEICVPRDQWAKLRETPWGEISYIDYKRKLELSKEDYACLFGLARSLGIACFASCWDLESVNFVEHLDPPAHKIASASLTDDALLDKIAGTGRPVIMSTGMSTKEQINRAFGHTIRRQGQQGLLALLHTTSTYPCPPEETNLRAMHWLHHFGVPIGYSGHEIGHQITLAAVAMGAQLVERHITLDRSMWGTDQAASLGAGDCHRLIRDIKLIEKSFGDGNKRVFASELEPMRRLRSVQ